MKSSGRFKIGIFWVYKNRVIGKARELKDGQENVPGLIDSPDSHIELWEQDLGFVIPFPELKGSEYQDVPRGRVIYSTKTKKVTVYMDKVLHTNGIREIISEFFQMGGSGVVWKTDIHYTTQSHEIDDLFDDELSETSEFVSDESAAWESPLPETEVGGYVFIPLVTLKMLKDEDFIMENQVIDIGYFDDCIDEFIDGCAEGCHCFFSVQDLTGNRIATAAYSWDSGRWRLDQCVGGDGANILTKDIDHSIDENSDEDGFYHVQTDLYYVVSEIERQLNLKPNDLL
ncbi:MAG: hypothetical protein KAH06_00200 [Desulfobacterales bacterium]|nr:hypothetical protein [Desulfobacterales bacterium]